MCSHGAGYHICFDGAAYQNDAPLPSSTSFQSFHTIDNLRHNIALRAMLKHGGKGQRDGDGRALREHHRGSTPANTSSHRDDKGGHGLDVPHKEKRPKYPLAFSAAAVGM